MLKHYLAAILVSAAAMAPLSPANAQDVATSAVRAAAIHDCSVLAGRYNEMTFGSTEYYVYKSCMARHGQEE